jgi:glycosyltransferase involved in cell wall biosynthesis
MSYHLSFIIATRNRLPFLKITLQTLLNELQPGEEIIVIDGNSVDGSKEYLQQLFSAGKIHQFLSEPDRNQAHAWNKAMLMARGTIIKKIIDDDVHDYKSIRKCKDFMLIHPEIDICISNQLKSNLVNYKNIEHSSPLAEFNAWKNRSVNTFPFSDVYMLIRKSSLSFLGLYDVQLKMIDWEYSLRATYLKARIAFYTGCNSLSVDTFDNISSTLTKIESIFEDKIAETKYGYYKGSEISYYSRIKIAIGKFIYRFKKKQVIQPALPEIEELAGIYTFYYEKLNGYNYTDSEWQFLY